jgi:hypothetical protein
MAQADVSGRVFADELLHLCASHLCANLTLTSPRASKPSNWFSNSNIVRWISFSPPLVES